MIKTLLVDDDFLVRMFLKQLIDWESQGFTLVGDACNGNEALELIDRFAPELIITDLSMPVMDGIELIGKARSRLPDCYIIALSCHGEFDYVKEAMKQGANEYVLKNLLDAPGLLKQLDTARAKLESAAKRAEQSDKLRQLAAKGTEMLRYELLLRLIHDETVPDLAAQLRDAGIDGRFVAAAAIAVSADAVRRDALVQVCGQFCRNKPAYCLPYDETSCCMLLDLSAISGTAAQTDWMRAFSSGLYRCIQEYLNVQPRMGLSLPCTGEQALHQAVCSAYHAAAYAFYDPQTIHDDAILSVVPGAMPEEAGAFLRRLPGMVEECLFERVCEEGLRILTLCQDTQAPPDGTMRWFGELLQIIGVDQQPPHTLAACREMLEQATQHLADERGTGCGNRAIQQAAAYLRENFDQPLSLASVAAQVHLNPAYLSFLFKREMGVNFSDYLQDCRMEHVKLLLRESDAPLKECAGRAGFSDYRNFCKLFKRLTGLRPAQYRSLNRA